MLIRQWSWMLAPIVGFAFVGCDVDVKDPGKVPEINVETEEGRMPDVDVRGPEVDVKTREKEVTVPDIDVKTEKARVTVPDVDVDLPKENDPN